MLLRNIKPFIVFRAGTQSDQDSTEAITATRHGASPLFLIRGTGTGRLDRLGQARGLPVRAIPDPLGRRIMEFLSIFSHASQPQMLLSSKIWRISRIHLPYT